MGVRRQLQFRWGKWIGRRDVIIAGSRGIPSLQARRILAERAAELRGAVLDGFWIGVAESRPEWSVAHVPGQTSQGPTR